MSGEHRKKLVQNGFPEGLRGKGGGCCLVRKPESYTVDSIFRLMAGSPAPVACLEQRAQPCGREAICRTLPVRRKLYEMVNDCFDGIALDALIASGQSGDAYVI